MTKISEQRIMAVLREAIELAGITGGQKISNRAIVERIYDSEPELMKEYQRQWSTDRMLWMIAKERRERYTGGSTEDSEIISMQINLPGFEDLPQTIFLRNGRRQKLDYANVTQINEHIAMLKARMERAPKIVQFERVLKVMRKYSEKTPDIRWIDVKRLELKT
jgi:hypothetical protein